MNFLGSAFFIVCLSIIFHYYYRRAMVAKREKLIGKFEFPKGIVSKIIEKYPHLDEHQADQVIAGMREYFHVCNTANHKMIAMPSQAVDEAWHEFILFTREYKRFCEKALGRFLHHTPAEAMKSRTAAQRSIQRAWKFSCAREGIAPKAPKKLPLLFALDSLLNIPDGFNYSLNCKKHGDASYCASHIGCGSGCSGDSSSCSSCSSGCGGD